ncbi:hypothetical protein RAZWK3B_01640 [Roseobacter sp. AzwK-3b]|uniref:hypothetical protein n=1 Tax=Roseobacter sp. AzwK-3b TaxID=351016 RepID=UPI0001568E1E|nr:hypothetical protein [Roseobacter sp. AzwK-3b]EDM72882.1 hypothetical protein RAZWK3B_01640 [Roseobacter sp. AzwK-3b]
MTLTLLHTAEIHQRAFDALRDRIAPGETLRHVVRPDWLARSQAGVPEDVAEEIAQAVAGATGAVLCTCTTIGPAAEAAGALRVDWPMMQDAARSGGDVLMVYTLESTLEPSLALLERALGEAGQGADVHLLALTQFWPLFEAGEREAFEAAIAGGVRDAVRDIPGLGAVVLAQGSMAGAAGLLADLGIPVLASPELALACALAAR